MFIQPNQAVKRCHLIELLAYQYTGSLVANTSNFDNFNFKVVPIDSNENLFRLVLTDFANISVIDGIPAIYDQNDNSRIMFKGNIMDALENYVTKSIKNQFPPRTGFGFPQRVTFA
jgi:exonuclease III